MRLSPPRQALALRVFLTNAAVLVGAGVFLVLTPATISSPVSVQELLVLTVATIAILFLNLFLLQRAFAPLDEFRWLMEEIDPLDPGRRVLVAPRADADIRALAGAFNGMLGRLETERRESALRALAAQEGERRRIARELHDELGQGLTGVLLLLDEAARLADGPAVATIDDCREEVRASIVNVRRIVRDLRPVALDDLGLLSALRALAASFREHTGTDVAQRAPEDLPALGPERELAVYRITQEALTNVARHAHAGSATLEVGGEDDAFTVVVSDDGDGFDASQVAGTGIRGMRERALLVGGTIDVSSTPGHGTTVALRIPLAEAA